MGTEAPDDYYDWFGVEPDAGPAELRRAWRRLAARWHPDRAGRHTTFIFQKLSAAYDVLSNPAARAAYDQRRRAAPAPSAAPSAAPPTGAPPAADGRRRAPGVMLSRLSGHLNGLLACGAARRAAKDLIELFLNGEEAAEGGMITIALQVPARCPSCSAAPQAGCRHCRGAGWMERLFSAWLALPPDVADGTVLEPSVQLRGALYPVRFRVRVPSTP